MAATTATSSACSRRWRPPSRRPSPSSPEGPLSTLDALQETLAGEHAALYAYGVLSGTHLGLGRPGPLCGAREGVRRAPGAARPAHGGSWSGLGATPVAAEVAYALPGPSATAAQVGATAREARDAGPGVVLRARRPQRRGSAPLGDRGAHRLRRPRARAGRRAGDLARHRRPVSLSRRGGQALEMNGTPVRSLECRGSRDLPRRQGCGPRRGPSALALSVAVRPESLRATRLTLARVAGLLTRATQVHLLALQEPATCAGQRQRASTSGISDSRCTTASGSPRCGRAGRLGIVLCRTWMVRRPADDAVDVVEEPVADIDAPRGVGGAHGRHRGLERPGSGLVRRSRSCRRRRRPGRARGRAGRTPRATPAARWCSAARRHAGPGRAVPPRAGAPQGRCRCRGARSRGRRAAARDRDGPEGRPR